MRLPTCYIGSSTGPQRARSSGKVRGMKSGIGGGGTRRVSAYFLSIVSFTALGCGNTSDIDPGHARDDAGLSGSSSGGSDAGSGGASGTSGHGSAVAGSNTGGASSEVPVACARPVSEWTSVSGNIYMGVANAAFVGAAVLVNGPSGSTGAIIPIDEQHPELAADPIAFGAPVPLTAAAVRLGPQFFSVGGSMGLAQLSSIGATGAVRSTPTTLPALSMGRGSLAAAGDRVVFAAGDGTGTFLVNAFDTSLRTVGSQQFPHHGLGAVRSAGQTVQLAVIDNPSRNLEIYTLKDSASSLERTHLLNELTTLLAWAGDSIVFQNGAKLTLIAPDDSRMDLAPPLEAGGSTVMGWLNATVSPLGLVIGVAINNKVYAGLVRNNGVEWVGPSEQAVFADVRADDSSLGAYFVTTLTKDRTVTYMGRRCTR